MSTEGTVPGGIKLIVNGCAGITKGGMDAPTTTCSHHGRPLTRSLRGAGSHTVTGSRFLDGASEIK